MGALPVACSYRHTLHTDSWQLQVLPEPPATDLDGVLRTCERVSVSRSLHAADLEELTPVANNAGGGPGASSCGPSMLSTSGMLIIAGTRLPG